MSPREGGEHRGRDNGHEDDRGARAATRELAATLIAAAEEENKLTTNLVDLAEKRNRMADRRTEVAEARTRLAQERTNLAEKQASTS